MATLGYHDLRTAFEANISSIPAVRIACQLDWLVAGSYRFVPLDSDATGSETVNLTLDDGLENQVADWLTLLSDRGIAATLFVPTQYIGKTAIWDYQGRRRKHADWAMLKRWCGAGHFVGSHGVSHRDLRPLSDRELAHELLESREQLEQHLGQAVRFLSYPFGRSDRRVALAARKAGYEAAYTTSPTRLGSGVYQLPRIIVSLLDTPLSVERRIRGVGWGRLERTKQRIVSFWSGGTAWQQKHRGDLQPAGSA
jgi:peptidoglycan/xylan/chitin deacetylase (PgdA/CDA1 family)